MTPKSFDEATCRELVGHERTLALDTEARTLAENGEKLRSFVPSSGTYWSNVIAIAEHVILTSTYEKRIARMKRIQENSGKDHCKK